MSTTATPPSPASGAATAEDERLRLAVLVGSDREGRFAPVVAEWFTAQARRHGGLEIDVLDVAELGLPTVMGSANDSPALRDFAGRVDRADAFVVVTPEYNHGYPAPLKLAIDSVYREWQGKAVGFVSYGGVSGGLRAVEQLRQVFAEVHTVTVRETVSFHAAWERFDGDGTPHDADRVNAAAKVLLDQLVWWGRALREARAKRPYGS